MQNIVLSGAELCPLPSYDMINTKIFDKRQPPAKFRKIWLGWSCADSFAKNMLINVIEMEVQGFRKEHDV